jgi:ABC-type polysaccharide/polyol phosphate export permease
LWFPIIVLVQLFLSIGLALFFSAMTVHFRDLKDLLGNLLTLWFFATPIIYPMQDAPPAFRPFLNLNPMTHLVISYQEVLFFEGPFGHWKWLLALVAASMGVFLVGYFVFDRLRDSFAEEV